MSQPADRRPPAERRATTRPAQPRITRDELVELVTQLVTAHSELVEILRVALDNARVTSDGFTTIQLGPVTAGALRRLTGGP